MNIIEKLTNEELQLAQEMFISEVENEETDHTNFNEWLECNVGQYEYHYGNIKE